MDILKEIKKCNVSYHILGKSDRSSMPLGNGELCTNIWVDEEGQICFYLSRSDALTELDRNVKLGFFKINISPNPFIGNKYEQTLDVADGYIKITGEDACIKVYIDPDKNQIVLNGEFESCVDVRASYYTWRKKDIRPFNEFAGNTDVLEKADTVITEKDRIWFYHKNGKNIIEQAAKLQAVDDHMDVLPDFLTGRIFGGCMIMKCSEGVDGTLILRDTKHLTLKVITNSIQGSVEQFTEDTKDIDKEEYEEAIEERCKEFWNEYWENSYILVENDKPAEVEFEDEIIEAATEVTEYTTECKSPITNAYVLTRFMMKCCQDGHFPVFYNGLLFNLCPGARLHYNSHSFGKACTALPDKYTEEFNPDERPWCSDQLWQNIRHPYHTFLDQGEDKALKALFEYYRRFWDLNRIRAEKYYSAKGQHNTEMTLTYGLQSLGVYGEDREGKSDGYTENRYGGAVDISPGLELLSLMLDYYDYTKDNKFLKEEILVYGKDLCEYIETRYPLRIDGKMELSPLNCIETYWDAKNPISVVAGLKYDIERILKTDCTDTEKEYFKEYYKQIPDIYYEGEGEEKYILPAYETDGIRHNVEIPELYACFPFKLFTQYNDKENVMKRTFEHIMKELNQYRYFRIGECTASASYSGWQYHGIVAAQLGMDEMAKDILQHNVQLKNPGTRFPAMWGPIYDAVPDTDHGSNIIHLIQKMVMQVNKEKVYVLPAFPKEWNVSFKLHPDKETYIEGIYEDGKLIKLEVFPEEAKNRVVNLRG